MSPLFVWLLLSGDSIYVQIASLVFLIAVITDWYDGWYARKYNASSRFGVFFDPLADKVLTGSALFAFTFLGVISFWGVFVITFRDVYVTVLRIIAEKNLPVKTSLLAKWKTALQFVFIWYLVLVFTIKSSVSIQKLISVSDTTFLFSKWILDYSMFLLLLLSVITSIQYTIDNKMTIKSLFNYQ